MYCGSKLAFHSIKIIDVKINDIFCLLTVLNNHEDYMKDIDDPYPPNEVIDALKHHGWTISPGEQDAHELFHLFILTLEEEAQRNDSSVSFFLN